MIGTKTTDVNRNPLIAVPSNVGPSTMPNYPALAAQGIYDLGNGVRVFVGQREETFYIDLGATFDTLSFGRTPPILTLAEDQNNSANPFGVDDGFEGLNITTIAIEIPKSLFPSAAVGMYASTSRQRNREFERRADNQRVIAAGSFRSRGWRILWSMRSSSAPVPRIVGTARNQRTNTVS